MNIFELSNLLYQKYDSEYISRKYIIVKLTYTVLSPEELVGYIKLLNLRLFERVHNSK